MRASSVAAAIRSENISISSSVGGSWSSGVRIDPIPPLAVLICVRRCRPNSPLPDTVLLLRSCAGLDGAAVGALVVRDADVGLGAEESVHGGAGIGHGTELVDDVRDDPVVARGERLNGHRQTSSSVVLPHRGQMWPRSWCVWQAVQRATSMRSRMPSPRRFGP